MTWPEVLQAASLVVPGLSLVFYVGSTHQKIKNIEALLVSHRDAENSCKTAREEAEEKLHGRITETEKGLAHLKGRMNGYAAQ
jgi:hypothetical protein